MAETVGELLEIRTIWGASGGLISCPVSMRPGPGQYLLANSVDSIEILPTALFLGLQDKDEGVLFCGDFPDHWTAGMKIHLRGPMGHGFHLPGLARRIALVVKQVDINRLSPLIPLALQQKANIVLYTDQFPEGLTPEIEVFPLDQLVGVAEWADYLAADIRLEDLRVIRQLLGLGLERQRVPFTAEILLRTPMPCGGTAECGVCSVLTHQGYQFACKDGPVFDLNHLEIK